NGGGYIQPRQGGAYRPGVHEHPNQGAALEPLVDEKKQAGVESALGSESATYSTLQAGPEHRAWLARLERHAREDDGDAVLMAREGSTLRLTLNRPHVRNAFNAAMREALLDGLAVAEADHSLTEIVVDG